MYRWKDLAKKWRIVQGKTVLQPKKHYHPTTDKARKILLEHNRDLMICQECGNKEAIQIHHRDGNPFNDLIENLAILCRSCHTRKHFLPDGVVDEFENIPYADNF